MNKKIIAFVVVVALSAMIFSGCTFIKKNEEREANEVLASVSSDGFTLTVTRNELLTYVNYVAQQYAQYGSSPDFAELVPEIYDYLISQKYLIIKGMVYLQGLPHRQNVMAGKVLSGVPTNTPEGVLTLAERYSAIKTVNETFQSEIDSYMKEYEDEQKNMKVSEVENEIALLKQQGYEISKTSIKEGSYKEEYLTTDTLDENNIILNIHMTKGTEEKILEHPFSSALVDSENAFTLELSSEESTKKVVTKQVVLKYEEPIEGEEDTTYISHKSEPVSYKLVKPRGTTPVVEEENFLEGTIKGRYNTLEQISAEDKAEYFNYSTASTKELNESFRRFREAKKAMLINFEADGLSYYYRSQFESAILSAVQHELERTIGGDAITSAMIEAEYSVLYERQKEEYSLLTPAEQVTKFTTALSGSGEIALDSIYYVPEAALAEAGYALEDFVGIAHILFKFDDTQSAFIKSESTGMNAEQLKALKNKVAQNTTTSRSNPDYDPEFEGEWTGETGVDPKLAFDPDGIDVNVYGENSVYDALYAELKAAADGAERFEIFKKYMTYYNDDNGAFVSSTGYPIFPEGITHSYDGDDFPELGRALAARDLSQGSVFLGEGESEHIGYAFTSYGVHWMMISFVPFVEGAVENNAITLDTVLNLEGGTHRDLIKELLLNTLRTNAYTEFSNSHTQEKALEQADKNLKKFEKLMKELGLK